MHSLSHYQGSSVKEVNRTRGRATTKGGEGKGEEKRPSGQVHLPKHSLKIPKQAEPWRPCWKEGCPTSSLPSIPLQQWENREFCKILWLPGRQPHVHLLSMWERSLPWKTGRSSGQVWFVKWNQTLQFIAPGMPGWLAQLGVWGYGPEACGSLPCAASSARHFHTLQPPRKPRCRTSA